MKRAKSLLSLIGSAAFGLATLAVAPRAHATLQLTADVNGTQFFCADGMACDQMAAANDLLLANQNIGGVIVNGSLSTATGTSSPAIPGTALLNSSSLSVFNTLSTAVDVMVAVSATNFISPVNQFAASGSGTFQLAIGGSMKNWWIDDPNDGQGAAAGSCDPGAGTLTNCHQPGTVVQTSPLFAVTSTPESYSFNFGGAVSDPNPFSMTLVFEFTLPGATGACNTTTGQGCPSLVSRGQALQKTDIPEPATLGLLGAGMAWLGLARKRRGRG